MLDAWSIWTAIAFWTALGVVLSVWIYTSAQTRKRANAQAGVGHDSGGHRTRALA